MIYMGSVDEISGRFSRPGSLLSRDGSERKDSPFSRRRDKIKPSLKLKMTSIMSHFKGYRQDYKDKNRTARIRIVLQG